MAEEPATKDRPARINRRAFLKYGGGGLLLTASGFVGHELTHSPVKAVTALHSAGSASSTPPAVTSAPLPVHHFVSRADLQPPLVTWERLAPELSDEAIFLAPKMGPGPAGALILDARGRVVWFRPAAPGKQIMNFRPQSYQGQPVLTWWEGAVSTGVGSGEYVIADSSYREIKRFGPVGYPGGDLHEFVITPQDSALITVYHQVPADLTSVGGVKDGMLWDSMFQEIDIATGRLLFEWHSREHIALDESEVKPVAGQPYDYFHINSVAFYDAGSYVVSARNTWALYNIERSSGAVVWRLGGRKSDFTMGPGTTFAYQHDARVVAPGVLTVFDDGAAPAVEVRSRALTLGVDTATMAVTLRDAFVHPANLLAGSQGNVESLGGGHTFVGWGAEPYFSEFAADGTLIADGRLPAAYQSYRAFRRPWKAAAAELPAVEVEATGDGEHTVYGSWNGATEVGSWQVHAGATPQALAVVASARRSGFETAITIHATGPYVAVSAHDAEGRLLARSPTIKM